MLCLFCKYKEYFNKLVTTILITVDLFVLSIPSRYKNTILSSYLKVNTYLTITDKHIDLRFYFSVLLLKELCNTKLLKLYGASCPQTNLF